MQGSLRVSFFWGESVRILAQEVQCSLGGSRARDRTCMFTSHFEYSNVCNAHSHAKAYIHRERELKYAACPCLNLC